MNIGDEFHRDYDLSEEQGRLFVELSQDRNPLHMDAGYARAQGYRDRVVHGNVLGAFLSHFVGEVLPVKKTLIVSQTIQFRQAMHYGDSLQFHARLTELHECVSLGVFEFKFTRKGQPVANGNLQVLLLT